MRSVDGSPSYLNMSCQSTAGGDRYTRMRCRFVWTTIQRESPAVVEQRVAESVERWQRMPDADLQRIQQGLQALCPNFPRPELCACATAPQPNLRACLVRVTGDLVRQREAACHVNTVEMLLDFERVAPHRWTSTRTNNCYATTAVLEREGPGGAVWRFEDTGALTGPADRCRAEPWFGARLEYSFTQAPELAPLQCTHFVPN
jgi:hypothetical protein